MYLSIKVSYKLIQILMGMFKYFQIPQKSKFTMSLQYLKKEVIDPVVFLHADKHQSLFQHFGDQSFLQCGINIIDSHGQAFSKYLK